MGHQYKVPCIKKGDKTQCSNYRGISPHSI